MEYKPLYKVAEVSKILLMNSSSVYKLIKSGELPAIKLGELKVRGRDLERFIDNLPVYTGDENKKYPSFDG